jgi:integrase
MIDLLAFLYPANLLTLLQRPTEHDSELLPMVAIQLFAGLRRSEVCALDWSEIDICEKHLEVKGVKSKTRQRRLVTLQPPQYSTWEKKGQC